MLSRRSGSFITLQAQDHLCEESYTMRLPFLMRLDNHFPVRIRAVRKGESAETVLADERSKQPETRAEVLSLDLHEHAFKDALTWVANFRTSQSPDDGMICLVVFG